MATCMCWHGNSRCVNEIPCMESKDYYTVLGVTPAEGLQAIRQAYRSLAKRYHPDYAGQEGHTQFQEIQEAYEVLSDPRKRKEYDANDRWSAGGVVPNHRPQTYSDPCAGAPRPSNLTCEEFPHAPLRPVGSAMDAAVRSSRLVPSVKNSILRPTT